MASYYSQVEDAIKENERELQHLRDEMASLRSAEKDIPRESFQREYESIQYHIEQQTKYLEQNRNLLRNYDSTMASIQSLIDLGKLYDNERDIKVRDEINEKMEALFKEFSASMNGLTEDAAKEIRAYVDGHGEYIYIGDDRIKGPEVVREDNNPGAYVPTEDVKINDEIVEPEVAEGNGSMEDDITDDNRSGEYVPTENSKVNDEISGDNNHPVDFDPTAKEEVTNEGDSKIMPNGYVNSDGTYSLSRNDIDEEFRITRIDGKPTEVKGDSKDQNSTNKPVVDANLNDSYESIKEELAQAERDYQASRVEMKRIFDEERDRKLNGDLFTTVEELDAFYDKYMQMKVEENERFLDASRRMEEARNKLSMLEQKMEQQANNTKTSDEPRKVDNPGKTIKYTPGKAPIGIPILGGDNNNVPGLPGPVAGDDKPGLPGPVAGDDKPKLPGPVIGDDKPGLPGPVAGDDKPKLPGPVAGDDKPGLPGPVAGDDKPRLPGPVIGDDKPRLPGPVVGDTPRLPGPVGGEKPPVNPPQKKEGKRDLENVIYDLLKDIDVIKPKDGQRYKRANLKVTEEFKNELHSGNYLYNIVHFVPAIVKLPIKFFRKITGNLLLSDRAKNNAKILEERLNNLSEEDLMILHSKYRGVIPNAKNLQSIFNVLVSERLEKFVQQKADECNNKVQKGYNEIFSTMKLLQTIDKSLSSNTKSAEEKEALRKYRKSILKGKAKLIESIRAEQVSANDWLSHGNSEDIKAGMSGMSRTGKRFAKQPAHDPELIKKESDLRTAENKAIANDNDEEALMAFIRFETLQSDNTEISNSIFGKRSTGKRYYSPLAERLDYRDDPFIRDLFTTVAITSAAISAVNALKTHAEIEKIIDEQQDAIKQNEQIIEQARQAGVDITSRRGTMMEGMKAQANQDVITTSNEIERAVLDKWNWKFGSSYRADDKAGHTFFNDFYNDTQASIQDIATKYGAGAITEQQALQLMGDVTNNTQGVLSTVTDECLKILGPYAKSHPQFDLAGVQGAMDYIVQNPNAISEMNNAIIDIDAIGETLSGLTPAQAVAFNSIPSDVRTTIVAAAASTALASNVSTTMNENMRRGKYGNAVTDMVNEYAEQQAQAEASAGRNK